MANKKIEIYKKQSGASIYWYPKLPNKAREVILFSCVLLKSNHTTFLIQFRIYLHSCVFQNAQIAFVLRAHALSFDTF